MIPLFLVLTALRKFIIVAINFVFVIFRASNILVMIMVLLNNDVCILYVTIRRSILERVFLCFVRFLFRLGINLYFVGTSWWVDTIRVVKSAFSTIVSLRNFPVYVRLFPSFIPTCITVRCLHIQGWNHFLESVCLKWVDSGFPVDGLIPTMDIIRWVQLPILHTIIYLASAAWASAMRKCLCLRLRRGCFHIIFSILLQPCLKRLNFIQ